MMLRNNIFNRAAYLFVLGLSLFGCASKQTIDQDPTIQMLAERAAKIEPGEQRKPACLS